MIPHSLDMNTCDLPVIIMAPSTGHKKPSSSVMVLLNIAGVDANLHIKRKKDSMNISCQSSTKKKKSILGVVNPMQHM